jgi:rRNA maturation protein Nop10
MTNTKSKVGQGTKAPMASVQYVIDQQTGCWNVTGKTTPQGYKPICRRRNGVTRTLYAHRLMYEHHNGVTLQSSDVVCHSCDNPRCVNPAHLWVGSDKDNAIDTARKGRNTAEMTREQALYVIKKKAWAPGEFQLLASAFGVGYEAVGSAARGETWNWLRDELTPEFNARRVVWLSPNEDARLIAQQQGQVRYTSQRPCARNHIGERYTLDTTCLECGRINGRASRSRRKARKENQS